MLTSTAVLLMRKGREQERLMVLSRVCSCIYGRLFCGFAIDERLMTKSGMYSTYLSNDTAGYGLLILIIKSLTAYASSPPARVVESARRMSRLQSPLLAIADQIERESIQTIQPIANGVQQRKS